MTYKAIKINYTAVSNRMNKYKILMLVLMTFAMFVMWAGVGAARGAITTVDDSGGADYMGIQDAIISASPEDMLVVYRGEYHENLIIKGGKAHDIYNNQRIG